MARSSILAGRTLSDLLSAILCGTIVLITGFVIGWRPRNGLVGVIAGLGVAVFFAYALSWFTACIGLPVSDPESAQAVGLIILFPLAFVSSCFVPTQGLPQLAAGDRRLEPGVGGGRRRAASCSATPTRRRWRTTSRPSTRCGMALVWSVAIIADLRPARHPLLRKRTTD